MVWVIIVFFVIMIWKYFSYDDDVDMKGYKSFVFALVCIISPFIVYIMFISVRTPIKELFMSGNFVGLICFLFGCFIGLFPAVCVLVKAFQNDDEGDEEDEN